MKSEINIPQDGKCHPFFVKPSAFLYRIYFRDHRNRDNIITYSTPHEIILNLHAFKSNDTITYINRTNNQEVFTVTINRFKSMIAESIHGVTQDELELLYLRLLLTNRYSKTIIDRGQFLQYDLILKRYLITIKGGMDSYLAYENRKVILYFKYRRLSTIHLLAVILNQNEQNGIHINHINILRNIANQGLLLKLLGLDLRKEQLRIYNYDPLEEDNIQPTTISREIIQVINQLIK